MWPLTEEGCWPLLLKVIDGMWDGKSNLCQHTVSEKAADVECDREHASPRDLEQFLSAAEVPVQMQEKRVPALSVCRRWQSRLNGGAQGRDRGVGTTRKSPCKLLNSVLLQRRI